MINARHRRFAEEYLVDLNATQAAIRAGYAPKSAEVTGSRLLSNPKVRDLIDQLQAERSERTNIKADDVLRELHRIAMVDLRDLVQWGPEAVKLIECGKLTKAQAACVAEVTERSTRSGITRSIKLHSKLEALKLLGQHLGMFREVKDVNVRMNQSPLEEMTDDELHAIASGRGAAETA